MRSPGWRYWFPLAIVLGAAAVMAGWITHSRRQRQSGQWVSASPAEPHQPPLNINASELRLAADEHLPRLPMAENPPEVNLDQPNAVRPVSHVTHQATERTHGLAWFISIAVLLNLAARVLESSQQARFADLITGLTAASVLVAIVGCVALLVTWRKEFVWPRWLWRFSGLLAAMILSFIAANLNYTASASDLSAQVNGVVLWLLAIGLALVSAWQRPHHSTVALDEPINRREVIVLIGLLLFAFALRAIDVEHVPALILGDETKYGLFARNILALPLAKPFVTGPDGHWNFYYQIVGLFIRLYGVTLTALRMSSVWAGTLSVLATWAVARQLWGRRPALIAVALLATYHHAIHYSRTGVNSIDDALFSMTVFACVWLAWRTGQRRAWLMAALGAGLAQYFFVGGRLVLMELAALAVFWLISERRHVRAQALNMMTAITVFICIVMPVLYFWTLKPDDYLSSLNTKNIYRSGWVQERMQATHQSEIEVLGEQLRDVISAFSFASDESFYWGQTMLTPIMSLLAVIGLLYFIAHIRAGPYFWAVSSLTLLLLFGGVLVVSPTAGSHRLLGSGPLIYIMIAVVIDRAWRLAEIHITRRMPVMAAGLIAVGLLMFADARYYFVNYLTISEPTSPEVPLNVLHHYLIDLSSRINSPSMSIACFGLNSDYCRGTNVKFLAPDLIARADVIVDLSAADEVPPANGRLQFVIVNARLAELAHSVQQRYPTLTPLQLASPQGEVYFLVYEIPPPDARGTARP